MENQNQRKIPWPTILSCAVIVICLAVIWRDPGGEFRKKDVAAHVEEVRVIAQIQQKNPGGAALPLAVFGGMVAGTGGAVLGAAAGSDSQIQTFADLKGCKMITTIEGRRFEFNFLDYDVISCALLKKDDVIRAEKHIKRNGGFWYSWHGVIGEFWHN